MPTPIASCSVLDSVPVARYDRGEMNGIRFLTDSRGRKTAVLIDLDRYGEIWEDFYDLLVARRRAREPRETLNEVKERLRRKGKLGA